MPTRLHSYPGKGIAIADAVAALALPPPGYALVGPAWNSDIGTVPRGELEIWADAARALTAVTLYGAHTHALVIADNTFVVHAHDSLDLATKTTHCDTVIEAVAPGPSGISISFAHGSAVNAGELDATAAPAYVFKYKTGVTTVANFESKIAASVAMRVKTPGTGATLLVTVVDDFADTPLAGGGALGALTAVAHGRLTGDGPVQLTTTGGLPGGLQTLTDLWFIKIDADTFALAASRADALTGSPIALTSDGTGVETYSDTADTERVHWHTHGLLGLAGDGAIALDAQKSFMTRFEHSPRAIAYAITATFGAGAGLVSARVFPVLSL